MNRTKLENKIIKILKKIIGNKSKKLHEPIFFGNEKILFTTKITWKFLIFCRGAHEFYFVKLSNADHLEFSIVFCYFWFNVSHFAYIGFCC